MNQKPLQEITRKEWIIYEWFPVDEFGVERQYFRGQERSPSEAVNAAEEWDFLQSIKDEED